MKKRLLSLIMSVVMCLSLLPMGAAAASGDVLINETNFPDPSFRAALMEYPSARDGKFTRRELDEITGLNLFYKDIHSLKGIEHFRKLNFLNCQSNHLTQLDISRNPEMRTLLCDNNQLSWLNVSHNPELDHLACTGNQLRALDVSHNPKLHYLLCSSNMLSSLDVSHNPELIQLDCSLNHLTSMDVRHNGKLDSFSCGGNWGHAADRALMNEVMPGFDPSRAANLSGGYFENGRVVYNPGSDRISYVYLCSDHAQLNFSVYRYVFADVATDDWFYKGVRYTTDKGIFSGVAINEFGPDVKMTRAMLVQTLYAMAGRPEVEKTHQFPDVKDSDWFSSAVAWAVQNHVASGYTDGRFGANDPLSREQLAVMLHSYRNKPAASKPLSFIDTDEISGWARPAVQWAVEKGLMTGVSGNRIAPQVSATRSQAAVILMNFDQLNK